MAARAAIFDLDGTLVDSRHDIAAAANAARVACGLAPLDLAAIVGFVGDGAEKLIERLVPHGDPATRAAAYAAFTAHYGDHCCVHTRPYTGMVETLGLLEGRGWRLAVATNKPLAFTQRILDQLGLARWFAGVRGGDRVRKPDPAPVLELLRELGAAASASWMIGDHHTDIRAGRGAGCRVAWCDWGIGDRAGLSVDATAPTPADLPRILEL